MQSTMLRAGKVGEKVPQVSCLHGAAHAHGAAKAAVSGHMPSVTAVQEAVLS